MAEVKELIRLVDYSQSNPALPPGHPFINVQSAIYWSATSNAFFPSNAWQVNFVNGNVNFFGKGNNGVHAWCVR